MIFMSRFPSTISAKAQSNEGDPTPSTLRHGDLNVKVSAGPKELLASIHNFTGSESPGYGGCPWLGLRGSLSHSWDRCQEAGQSFRPGRKTTRFLRARRAARMPRRP